MTVNVRGMTIEQARERMSEGQYLRCDSWGGPLEIVDYLTNGLGRIYQMVNGGLELVEF